MKNRCVSVEAKGCCVHAAGARAPSRRVVICACGAEEWELMGLPANIMCISRPHMGSGEGSDCAKGHTLLPVLKPPICVLGSGEAGVIDTFLSNSVTNENTQYTKQINT